MKLVSKLSVTLAVGVVVAAISACGSSGGKSSPAGSPAASSCTSTVAGWCDLVAKAKSEGQFVVLAGPEGVGDDGDYFKAFGKEFGLKVTVVGGAADEVNSKIVAERSEGQYTADISSQGDNGTKALLAAKAFQPLAPLFLPGMNLTDRTDASAWRVDYLPWEDPGKEFCSDIAVESQINFAPVYYNTKLVKGADLTGLTSWQSLLDPKWKGKIVMGDIADGDDSSDVVRAYLTLGPQWFSNLILNQKPKVLPFGSERQEADELANGAYAIGLFPAGEDSLQTAVSQKLPIASLATTMSEGTTGTPIQRLCAMDHPAHPAAAQLFVNWSLSKEGQTAFNATTNRTDRVALRKDVPQGKISDQIWKLAQETKSAQIIDPSSPAYLNGYKDAQADFKKLFVQAGIKP